jgi:hypothetical protein
VAEAGLSEGFWFHDLRHIGNTLAASSGTSTRELMHRMGQAIHSKGGSEFCNYIRCHIAGLAPFFPTEDRPRAAAALAIPAALSFDPPCFANLLINFGVLDAGPGFFLPGMIVSS